MRTPRMKRSIPGRTGPHVIVDDAERVLASDVPLALTVTWVVIIVVSRPRWSIPLLDGGEGEIDLDGLLGCCERRREQEPRGVGVGRFEGFTVGGDENEAGLEAELGELVRGVAKCARWRNEIALGGLWGVASRGGREGEGPLRGLACPREKVWFGTLLRDRAHELVKRAGTVTVRYWHGHVKEPE